MVIVIAAAERGARREAVSETEAEARVERLGLCLAGRGGDGAGENERGQRGSGELALGQHETFSVGSAGRSNDRDARLVSARGERVLGPV